MTDNLDDIRESAWNHVRRTIGDHFLYNDLLAGDDIYRMTATEATRILTMTPTQITGRWAPETGDQTTTPNG